MKYDGYDFTELEAALSPWLSPKPEGEPGHEQYVRYQKAIDDVANDIFHKRRPKKTKRACREIRAYLEALAKMEERIGYGAPVWRGIAAVTDDWTLCAYFGPLMQGAWS